MIHRIAHAAFSGSRHSYKSVLWGVKWPKNLARRTFSTGGSIHDSAGEVEELLLSLEEVKNADNLALTGRHSEAVPFLQRAVEICTGSVGEESTLARAALRRLGQALYNAGQYTDAEAVFKREVKNGESTSVPALLLLSKSQLFQGRLSQAVEASSQAVALCEKHDDYTPDTDALGQALRQLGVTQMLHGAREDAETSLLRAARLGSTSMDQAKGLSVLAAYNAFVGGEQEVEEALELWREARNIEADAEDEDASNAQGIQGKDGGHGEVAVSLAERATRLTKASVLCSAAQGELLLGKGVEGPSACLADALKIREELLPHGHPATAWTLALIGRCHFLAGEAVTSEGLFRTALSGLEPSARGLLNKHPSPVHPHSLAVTLNMYSELLLQWEKREDEGGKAHQQAEEVESSLHPKPQGGLTIHQLHLDDVY